MTSVLSRSAGALFRATVLVGCVVSAGSWSCNRSPKALPGGADAAQDAGATDKTSGATDLEKTSLPPTPEPLAPGETVQQGSAVAMSREGDRLYIADEDHATLRIVELDAAGPGRLPLPPKPGGPAPDGGSDSLLAHGAVTLPGRPANIVVTASEILVTIRDPGLLVTFRREGAGVVETARLALPADAWGLAVSPDEKTAVVTSAWTHRVSSIDLETKKLLSSVDVGREPRGVVVRADGNAAYVSHLVATPGDLTRVDGLRDPEPRVHAVKLPVARLRAPPDSELSSSLAYALALSKDGKRLYAPRHALGAVGDQAWFGATTIDVLLTATDEPLAPRHVRGAITEMKDGPSHRLLTKDAGPFPLTEPVMFVQPRSVQVVGEKLYVLSEGMHAIYRTSATAIDPALAAEKVTESSCRAPAGMVVTSDVKFAYVFCRAPYDLEALDLQPSTRGGPPRPLAKDLLSNEAAVEGRAIFLDASDPEISGGLACAGCHPEGRDDGHVWHEIETRGAPFAIPASVEPRVLSGGEYVAGVRGFPRQTPMLAGRVKAEGPYGWHAENPNLRSRIEEGVHLHRWNAAQYDEKAMAKASGSLAAFLRQGLVPPPREKRALTPVEEHGKKLFDAEETQCATCHAPAKEFTDRAPRVLRPWPPAAGFDDEPPGSGFKPPSLLFVQGTAPYYHDGSAPTLEGLVADNKDRMGKTSQLTAEERAALVAYLRTL